jgi:hypothetical protein
VFKECKGGNKRNRRTRLKSIAVIVLIDFNNNNNNNNNNFGDRNVIKKEAEKILKHKDITIEIQRMWNVKTKVIPVIIGATGTISKSFRKYVSNIPGNHEVKELQKAAILGTVHIPWKVLTWRCNGVNAGTSDMSTINKNTRIAATQCSLGTWFVSGI